MKKILLILVGVAGLAVHADVLYWMVEANPQSGKTISGGDTAFHWTDAKLFANGTQVGSTLTSSAWAEYKDSGDYAWASIGEASEYNNKSFTIELFNGDTWLARSVAMNGSQLSSFITGPLSMNPPASGWMPTTYAVPEPTTGMLLVIGGMLLGLKRKRQV